MVQKFAHIKGVAVAKDDRHQETNVRKAAFIYIGPPIVGKDAQTVAYKHFVPVFMAGDELRIIAGLNPGGPEDMTIRSGGLAPDGVIMPVGKTWIRKYKNNPIIKLNGLPRNVPQMPIIEFLRELGFTVNVIWFTTPIEACLARPFRTNRPHEDTPQKRLIRMETYKTETLPMKDELGRYGISDERGNLFCIDNSEIQKHEVAQKIITHFRLPFEVSQLFPAVASAQAAEAVPA